MKITALTENTAADPRVGCEHGLSLYIEANGYKILFDTGQSELFAENAGKLGVDLSKVDICVLSHGHYDHSGGLRRFTQLNDHAPVYLNRHAFEPHYNAADKYIGIDAALKGCGRLVFTDEQAVIGGGLTLYACNELKTLYPVLSAGLKAEIDGELVPDDFRHEHYLLIEEGAKRVLVSGCSHTGILNLAEWFRPDVLIGGFHLMKVDDERLLTEYAARLNAAPAEYYTCHCTGTQQYEVMKRHMDRLRYLSAGQTIEI